MVRCIPIATIYLSLDPTYKDRFGRPLMRITIDFHDNELKMSSFLTDKYAEILQAMGAKQIVKKPRKGPYDVTEYQTSHLNGGAIMGDNPGNSALNRYLQSWDVPNLFVIGRFGVSAECRLQPDRAPSVRSPSGRPRRSVRNISKIRGRSSMREDHRYLSKLARSAVARRRCCRLAACRPRRRRHRQAGFRSGRSTATISPSPAIAPHATPCQAAAMTSPAAA